MVRLLRGFTVLENKWYGILFLRACHFMAFYGSATINMRTPRLSSLLASQPSSLDKSVDTLESSLMLFYKVI